MMDSLSDGFPTGASRNRIVTESYVFFLEGGGPFPEVTSITGQNPGQCSQYLSACRKKEKLLAMNCSPSPLGQ